MLDGILNQHLRVLLTDVDRCRQRYILKEDENSDGCLESCSKFNFQAIRKEINKLAWLMASLLNCRSPRSADYTRSSDRLFPGGDPTR